MKLFKTSTDRPTADDYIREITERKRSMEELQKLYEREIKLREALEEERKKRIEFIRVLVHELKTPLTPVLAASNLLADELRDDTIMRLSKIINQGAWNLSNRIDELLDITKGELGTLHLELEPVDLVMLLHRIAYNVYPMASSNGHSLILDIPKSLPSVLADENRLQQVILNLLNNASKFTPYGEKITLRARREDSALIVEVQDTGNGISEEYQQRLFEPYCRVESDRQRLSGLGLGLALCKTLVELHGGRIWVESHPGTGSIFGFSLPLEAS